MLPGDAHYYFVNQDAIIGNTMSPLPQTLVNDSVDKRQIDEELGAEDGTDLDQSGSEEEDPWWRTYKLWKVNMRGLVDDDTS
jgi:hypothetical protein